MNVPALNFSRLQRTTDSGRSSARDHTAAAPHRHRGSAGGPGGIGSIGGGGGGGVMTPRPPASGGTTPQTSPRQAMFPSAGSPTTHPHVYSTSLARRAAELAGVLDFDVANCTDVHTLQRKVVETAERLVMVERAYEAQLQNRSAYFHHRLSALTQHVRGSEIGSGAPQNIQVSSSASRMSAYLSRPSGGPTTFAAVSSDKVHSARNHNHHNSYSESGGGSCPSSAAPLDTNGNATAAIQRHADAGVRPSSSKTFKAMVQNILDRDRGGISSNGGGVHVGGSGGGGNSSSGGGYGGYGGGSTTGGGGGGSGSSDTDRRRRLNHHHSSGGSGSGSGGPPSTSLAGTPMRNSPSNNSDYSTGSQKKRTASKPTKRHPSTGFSGPSSAATTPTRAGTPPYGGGKVSIGGTPTKPSVGVRCDDTAPNASGGTGNDLLYYTSKRGPHPQSSSSQQHQQSSGDHSSRHNTNTNSGRSRGGENRLLDSIGSSNGGEVKRGSAMRPQPPAHTTVSGSGSSSSQGLSLNRSNGGGGAGSARCDNDDAVVSGGGGASRGGSQATPPRKR